MGCKKLCHNLSCFDDKEHFCHDNDCVPERIILGNVKEFFIDVVRGGKGLSQEECKGVLEELSKYV